MFIAKRLVLNGTYEQSILVDDVVIAVSNRPLTHGEPIGLGEELVGKKYSELRGMGFRKQSPGKWHPFDLFPAYEHEGVKVNG